MLKKGMHFVLNDGRTGVVNTVNKRRFAYSSDGSKATVAIELIAKIVVRTCDKCQEREAVLTERFCKECRNGVLQEVEKTQVSYITSKPAEERGRKQIRSTEWLSHQSSEEDYGEDSMP